MSLTHAAQSRRAPDGSRVVAVRILPPAQEEPGPFADLIPLTDEQTRLIFAFGRRTANPAEQNTGSSSTNPATATN